MLHATLTILIIAKQTEIVSWFPSINPERLLAIYSKIKPAIILTNLELPLSSAQILASIRNAIQVTLIIPAISMKIMKIINKKIENMHACIVV